MEITKAHNLRIKKMPFVSVYNAYINKVEKKGKTKAELDTIINWLTGFSNRDIEEFVKDNATLETFFNQAKLNPNAHLITGVICGYRIEDIKNPLTKKVRYLDKLVDELAKGRKIEKIFRK